MTEETNNEYIKLLRKNIPQLDIALHINQSNLELIEFLENKVTELEKLIDNKEKEIEYTCCNNEITGNVKDVGLCPTCLEHL